MTPDSTEGLRVSAIQECGQFVATVTGDGVDFAAQGETEAEALTRLAIVATLEYRLATPTPEAIEPGAVERVAAYLIDQRDEPWPVGSDPERLHYWRDKAIKAANDLREIAALQSPPELASDGLVKHMTQRFLMWPLPGDFHPDNGISFKPTFNDSPEVMKALGLTEPMRHNPVGTNLFNADQAETMVRFMLDGLPNAD